MPVPLRVLLIEDSADDAVLLLESLRSGDIEPDARRVDSAAGVRDALARGPWNVVICDYHLPRYDGLAALKAVRKVDADVPFIMVSGAVGEEFVVEAMRAGAQDFVSKDRLVRLAPAVHRELGEAETRRARRRVEAALRESEERFRALADHMAQLAWMADEHGRTFWFNRRWLEYTGISLEEAQGWGWRKAHHPEHVERVTAKISRCFRTGEEWEDTFPLRGRDGSYRWFLSRALPIRDEAGRVTRWFGTNTDISAQREAERALRELNETLERRVAERMAVAEERSRQLQALAVQLGEAEERERRRIAELLHDDLQQILASARLQLQTARHDLPPSPILGSVDELLEESIRKSRHLSHELSPAILHHSGLAASLEWLAGQMKLQYGLEVALEAEGLPEDGGKPAAGAKALQVFIFRAVQELLFNVVKHAQVKSARVRLDTVQGWRIVTVCDDGRGFDPVASGFSPHRAGGFGLLSIRERTQAIGGSLSIDTAPGAGSRITLTVPLAAMEAVDRSA